MVEKTPQPKIEEEKIQFQRLDPIAENYRNAPDKAEFMTAMKKKGMNIGGENVTPIDFFATSQELSDDEIIEAIEGYLGVENIENRLEMINESLEKAKDYIYNYLHIKLPKEIQSLKSIKNKNDILKVFKKTAVVKKGEKIGLAPHYCALVSVFAAAFEFKKEELEGLIKESKYVYDNMFEMDEDDEIQNFHKFKRKLGGYDKTVVCNNEGRGNFFANSYFRGKGEDSFISKMINKPEANAKEAAKDGIGLKFEVETKEQVRELIPIISNYLEEKFKAKKIVFENDKLFKNGDTIYDEIDGIEENENPHSNKNFQSFKMNGSLDINTGAEPEGMIRPRDFEIQIVLTENDNESKFSHHAVYEASKKLSIVTRLLGVVTEKHLDIFAKEASSLSGLSEEKVRRYLKDTFLVEIKAKNSRKKRYAHKKTIDRLLNAGVVKDVEKVGEKRKNKKPK